MNFRFTLGVLISSILLLPAFSNAQNVGVDVASPEQKLDVAGGLRIGTTSNGLAGSIRWDSGQLQVHDGTSWVTLGANSDSQQLDVVQLSGTNLELSLQNDGIATHIVDLSSLEDNTDDQTIDLIQLLGSDLQISLEDDGQAPYSVDLSSLADTDNQTIDVYNITGDQLTLSLEDDGQAPLTVDLTPYKDNTDNQQLDLLQLTGTTLEISLEDDGQAPQTLDLSVFDDNTDNQTFDVIQLVGNSLELSLEDDGQATYSIDLSAFEDNTDDQTIDVFSLTGTDLNLSLEDDGVGTQTVDLSPLKGSLVDADGDTKVEVEANPDEDRIRFTTAAGERMIIREDGNVGIGTTAPDNLLTIGGSPSTAYPALGINSGNEQGTINNGAQIAFGYNNTDEYQHFVHTRHNQLAAINNSIDFYVNDGSGANNTVTSGSTHVMSMNAGNVGIGVTNPNQTLDVIGTGQFTGDVFIGASNATDNDVYISDRLIDWDNGAFFVDPASASRMNEVNFDDGSAGDPSVYFEDTNTGFYAPGAGQIGMTINGTEAVRINTARNVGIGTNGPAQKLHVVGNGRFTDMAGTGIRSLSVDADGDLTTATPTAGSSGFWTRSGNTLSPTNAADNIDMNAENITDFHQLVSTDIAQPKLVLNSISSGDNWNSQGAYISLGESGDLGAASLHMTYRGDGYGFIGSGAVANAEPGASYLRFDYNASNIYTPDNLSIGTTSTDGRLTVSGRVEFTSATDASGTAGTGVLEIGNALRIDDDEIITNTNGILYLQNDNGGDLRVDASTLVVDASANRVGIGTTGPSTTLDVNGTVRIRGGSPVVGAVLQATSTNGTATWSNAGYGQVPLGTIVAWHKNGGSGVGSLPSGWRECSGGSVNGISIPNLNGGGTSNSGVGRKGRFLRGHTSSGVFENEQTNQFYQANIHDDDDGCGDNCVRTMSENGGWSGWMGYWRSNDAIRFRLRGVETRPVNMSVVWIIRVE